MGIHAAAAQGFEADAAGYARGRPDYPAALDAWLRDALALGPETVVVDLGAGTGKFLPRLCTTGARIVAIEPVDAMRARLVDAHPDVEVHAGSAEAMPLADASIDAVVCAQAFHWFANGDALAEIRRVLKPGGRLALVWNVRDESVPWVRRLTAIVNAHEGATPRFHTGAWRQVFPADGFGPLEETRFRHVHVGPPDEVVVDRFLSVSFIAALPIDERRAVEAQLRRLIANEPSFAGRGTIEFPYETLAALSTRR